MLFQNLLLPKLLQKIKKYLPHLFFLLFLLMVILNTYENYGIAWDENRFISTGKYHLLRLLSNLSIRTNLIDDTNLYYYFDIKAQTISHGVFFDVLTVLLTLLFKTIRFETFHLIRGLFSIFIFIGLAYIVDFLFGRKFAFFSMIFLFLSPRFYGNIFVSPIDIPTALFFTIAISYFLYYLNSSRSVWKSIFFGFLMALLINQRLLMIYVLGIHIIIIVISEFAKKIKNWHVVFKQLLVIIIATLIFMHLTNPHLYANPVTGLYDMILLNSKFPFNASVLFDGQMIHASQLPWYYLSKYILITTPLFIIVLFMVGLFRLSIYVISHQYFEKKIIPIYILLLFFTPFVLNLIIRPVLYDGWRFFLFLTIPLIIIAIYGFEFIWSIKIRYGKQIVALWLALSVLATTNSILTLHPYEYVYFNSLVGSLKGADGKYETDYWALGNKEAVEWFNRSINDPKKNYRIMVEGDPFSASYYFRKNMRLTYDIGEADYYITFTRWNKHQNVPGKVVHIVSRQTTPLIFVYKINK